MPSDRTFTRRDVLRAGLLGGASVAAGLGPLDPARAATAAVAIDPAQRFQTISG